MSTYVKLPIEIQAVRWFKEGDHPAVMGSNLVHVSENRYEEDHYIITLEGSMIVMPGDWIITGVQGEHYPCKDEIFRATYTKVKEAE